MCQIVLPESAVSVKVEEQMNHLRSGKYLYTYSTARGQLQLRTTLPGEIQLSQICAIDVLSSR